MVDVECDLGVVGFDGVGVGGYVGGGIGVVECVGYCYLGDEWCGGD